MVEETSPTPQQAISLKSRVVALVQACPKGRVTTYSWIAKALGYPRGARMVGWIMNEVPAGTPAQRVLNSKGELSGSRAFGPPGRMRELLEEDGVVLEADDRVDLKKYGWDPARDLAEPELQAIITGSISGSVTLSSHLLQLLRSDPASPLRVNPADK